MNHVCQSCGMPLHDHKLYGTDIHGMPMEDYCIYCYKDGGFTSDVTMDEMMRLCANYVEGNSREYYIASMRTLYPHLKRWAKKENTQSEYYKSINRVINHVKSNLNKSSDLKTLAEIACISPYHFHRIFKSVIGESLADYVNRLKMEYVAEKLKNSGLGLSQLAENTGYSGEQALSRAFKKYFNLPPTVFRATYFEKEFGDELSPRVCKVADRFIICLNEPKPRENSWQKLYMYALVNRLLNPDTESIELIRTPYYIPALTTREAAESDKYTISSCINEGLYAIFTHKGNTSRISRLYEAIQNYWIPSSKYFQANGDAYIVYLNNPLMVPTNDILAEIYIPILSS